MYCRYCREKIDDNEKVCKSCGSNLITEKTKKYKYCKYCYTNNREDAKYCYKCSADLPEEIITDNRILSIIIGIILSFAMYFITYKVSQIELVTVDILVFIFLVYIVCSWLDGVINKKIEKKNNYHLSITRLISDMNHAFKSSVEIGNIYHDYEKDLKSTDIKIENKLFASKLFYHLRFLGKLAFALFLFMVLHSQGNNDLTALLFWFSIITNCF